MKKFLTLGLVATFLLSANIVFAKTNIVLAQAPLIPNVYIKNIQLQKTELIAGEVVKGTFEALTDSKTAASDIYFKISLVGDYQKNTLASAFYDSITMSSSYNLKAGEIKTINFSYTIPSVKTGTSYGIQIQGMTHTGIPLGWSDALVKITNTGTTQPLEIVDAKLTVDNESFGLQQGPMVPSGQKAVLDLVISNPTAQPVTITPTIALYDHVVLGKPLKTVSASSTTIAAGKQKEIFITLPTNNDAPLVYVSHITFPDVNKIERLTALDVRYIVQGDIAAIQSVSTDKKTFNQGDNIAVTLVYSGTPFDITTGKNSTNATYDTVVKLLNDQNQTLASWTGSIDYNATSSKTVILTAEQTASGYTVDVTVTKAGKTITYYSTKIAPDVTGLVAGTTSFWQYILCGALFGIIIILMSILMRRNKKFGIILLVLILLTGLICIVLSYSTIQKADAQIGDMTGVSIINYAGLTTANTVSSPVPDPTKTYLPGETFIVAGSVVSWGCTNNSLSVTSNAKIYDATDTTLISDSGDVGSTAAQFFAAGGGWANKHDYQFGAQYAVPVTAPTVPGTYKLHLRVQTNWGPYPATGWEGTQTITVGALSTETCPAGKIMVNNACMTAVSCPNGATNPSSTNPSCTTCPAGKTLVNNLCTAPLVLCTSFTYGDWGECISGTQAQLYTGVPAGCNSAPATVPTQPCVNITCAPKITDANGNDVAATFANVGQLVKWVVDGVGPYTWSGDISGGSTSGSAYLIRYQTIGNKNVSVASGTLAPVSCTLTNGLPNGLPIVNNPNFQPF